jgi:excisionase family DNA binding protein
MNARATSRLMSTGEVAKVFGVSVNTVLRWVSQGRLLCTKTLGGHRRFERAHVNLLRSNDWPSQQRESFRKERDGATG